MSNTLQYKPDAVCNSCGQYGAFDFGDEHLCSDCYAEKGSCCLEFGEHDLWKNKDNKSESHNKTDED